MTVNTYWHDGNLNINSDIDRREINQYATSEYDGPAVGPELLDDTGWTSTGYTGTWSTGFTQTNPYGNNPLINTIAAEIGHKYLISVDTTSGNFTITFGGVATNLYLYGPGSIIVTATTTGTFQLQGGVVYTVGLSIKEITSPTPPIYTIYDSLGNPTFEIRENLASTNNIFIGVGSGKNNVGIQNLGLGVSALEKNESGYTNTAIGYLSMFSNISGNGNTSIGGYSLYKNTTGYGNLSFASYALYNNTTGYNNNAFGASSLYNNIGGNNNIGIGNNSLYGNTTGFSNIGIGSSAGWYYTGYSSNANSTYSIFIGRDTLAFAANGVNEIVIGYQAVGNGSNTVTLGHTTITSTYLRGHIYPVDGKNIVLGTTTGMKIGTATNQKLGFFNSVPVVQQTATTDIGTTLSNLGLRAAGTAYPITTSGATSFTGTINLGGQVTVANGINFAINTSTGTKFGTATTQKLAFYNSTPIVQPVATLDLGTVLSNLGLRAAGTAYPITTSGAVNFTGGLTIATTNLTITDKDIALGTTTGTKVGTATNQKLAFHNSTPVIQRASASQAAVAVTASTNITPYGFTTASQADSLVTLVNELRAALVEKGLIKGAA